MLEFRLVEDSDLPLLETWLHKTHVRRWYEIPSMDLTLEDWMIEFRGRNDEFNWITHLIVLYNKLPIGLAQYYYCADAIEEDFGSLPMDGSYGIDYLIGEEEYLGKGLGKGLINTLVRKIFTLENAQRVTAHIDGNNDSSKNVLLANGFTLLDAADSRYVITKEQLT